MELRNKVWHKIKETDAFYRCAERYISAQNIMSRIYIILIPTLSALCILLAQLNLMQATTIVACLTFFSSFFKMIFPKILLSDLKIYQLKELGLFFENCREKLEDLMSKIDRNEISDQECEIEMQRISPELINKKSELNNLILWIPPCEKKKIQKLSEEYLLNVHFNKYN